MAETDTRERTEAPRVETPTRAPLVSQREGGAVAHRSAPVGSRPLSFREMLALAQELFSSGILPTSIKNKGQAFAIILAGQEMGVPPMRALRSINFAKGKLIVGADLQLALFKRSGGHARWLQYTDEVCELELIAPNGDKAVERFTEMDVTRAKLDTPNNDGSPSNHKKYPRFMKRSRCITGALKTIGFEDTAGAYDPDEIQSADYTGGEAPVSVVESRERPKDGPAPAPAENVPATPETAAMEPAPARSDEPNAETDAKAETKDDKPGSSTFDPMLFPFEPRRGIRLDAVALEVEGGAPKRDENGLPVYLVSEKLLQRAAQWVLARRKENPDDARFPQMLDALEKEIERRIDEHDAHVAARAAQAGNDDARPAETETASDEDKPDTTRAE